MNSEVYRPYCHYVHHRHHVDGQPAEALAERKPPTAGHLLVALVEALPYLTARRLRDAVAGKWGVVIPAEYDPVIGYCFFRTMAHPPRGNRVPDMDSIPLWKGPPPAISNVDPDVQLAAWACMVRLACGTWSAPIPHSVACSLYDIRPPSMFPPERFPREEPPADGTPDESPEARLYRKWRLWEARERAKARAASTVWE